MMCGACVCCTYPYKKKQKLRYNATNGIKKAQKPCGYWVYACSVFVALCSDVAYYVGHCHMTPPLFYSVRKLHKEHKKSPMIGAKTLPNTTFLIKKATLY